MGGGVGGWGSWHGWAGLADMGCMGFPVFVSLGYESRFALLGAMAREMAEALARKGCEVNPAGGLEALGGRAGMALWLNFLGDVKELSPKVTASGSRVALVQFFVDHPLALWTEQMDALARLPNFRMVLPCVDGLHLLRMRWPTLKHAHCLHGVSPAALAPADELEASHLGRGESSRDVDVVVTGSIHTEEEIEALKGRLPARVHRSCDEAAEMMERRAWTPFEQALDVAAGSDGLMTGEWGLLQACQRYVVAAVNRRRRIAVVRALRGLRVEVYGGGAWEGVCSEMGAAWRGEVAYGELPAALRRARVCVALGPTQFTHTFSERLLLSLAAGCATVADDRELARRHFGGSGCVEMFDAAEVGAMRGAIEGLLADRARCAAMGAAGREAVARGHLWEHRMEMLARVGSDAVG